MTQAHLRIDEGVKRGPRRAQIAKLPGKKAPRGNDKSALLAQAKLANLDPLKVIERYFSDDDLHQIADDLKVHRTALNQWLLRHCEEDWRNAQIARAITAKEDAKRAMREAQDALSLARARELLRDANWDLERLFNRLFGQKQEVTHHSPVQINIGIQRGEVDISASASREDGAEDGKVLIHQDKQAKDNG